MQLARAALPLELLLGAAGTGSSHSLPQTRIPQQQRQGGRKLLGIARRAKQTGYVLRYGGACTPGAPPDHRLAAGVGLYEGHSKGLDIPARIRAVRHGKDIRAAVVIPKPFVGDIARKDHMPSQPSLRDLALQYGPFGAIPGNHIP
jgi:hypothetical protein